MSDYITLELRSTNRAMVMELESVAVPTRRVVFEAVRDALSDQGIRFDEAAMIRHGLHAVPDHMVADLAAAHGLKPAVARDLSQRLNKAVLRHFTSPGVAMMLGLNRLLDAARSLGAVIGLVSWQEEPAAQALIERAGLSRWNPLLACFPNPDHEFPGTDTWLRLLKTLGRQPQDSVALCNTHAGCRSALTAGMRVVVVPDEFTLHQDFCGADAIAYHIDEAKPEMLFGEVLPAALSDGPA